MRIILYTLLMLLGFGMGGYAQSDNCITATALTECVSFSGSNVGATVGLDDNYVPGEICGTSIDKSVWFSFTASTTGPYTFLVSSVACTGSTNLETGVFTGTCGSLTAVNCDAGSSGMATVFNATAGQTYFIVIDGVAGSECSFETMICPGCNISAFFTPSVTAGAYPLTVSFNNTSVGGQFYTWDFGVFGSGFDGENAVYTYTEPGTFIVTLTAFNGVCTDTLSDTIVVTGASAIEIPNVFTPNDDENNDLFQVRCFGIKTLEVEIYNRWGELVGNWSGINGWWDGYSAMAGVKVAEGSYFYRIKAEGIDGTLFDEKGYLQLFR